MAGYKNLGVPEFGRNDQPSPKTIEDRQLESLLDPNAPQPRLCKMQERYDWIKANWKKGDRFIVEYQGSFHYNQIGTFICMESRINDQSMIRIDWDVPHFKKGVKRSMTVTEFCCSKVRKL